MCFYGFIMNGNNRETIHNMSLLSICTIRKQAIMRSPVFHPYLFRCRAGMEIDMKKKALAILYSSKTLCDFIWYYFEYGKEFEWDVLIDNRFCDIEKYLRKTGIFQSIYVVDKVFQQSHLIKKIGFLLTLFFYWLIDQRRAYSKKIVKRLTQGQEYSQYVVVPYGGDVLPGLVYFLGKDHDVVILEDGMGDYTRNTFKIIWKKLANTEYWAEVALNKMGYIDFDHYFNILSLKHCIKCALYPDKLKYTCYKEIRKIGVFTDDHKKEYNDLIAKTFDFDDIKSADVVVYTTPLADYTDDQTLLQSLIHITEEYINDLCNGRIVAIKRHPRDNNVYNFDQNIKIIEIDPVIPGEILEDNYGIIGEHISIFMYTTTIFQSIHSDNYLLFYYSELAKKSKLPYSRNIENDIKTLSIKKEKIIVLE